MFNARSVLDGISLSNKDSLGSKIAIPNLNIFDDSINPNNY